MASHKATRSSEAGAKPLITEAHADADFMVLHEGRIYFEGPFEALQASDDPFFKEFLFMTLPPW